MKEPGSLCILLLAFGLSTTTVFGCTDPDDDDDAGDDDDVSDDDASDDDAGSLSYAVVDTDQPICYDAAAGTSCPDAGGGFYGQDAQYDGFAPQYSDHGDGTVTDGVTGLMWQQDPGDKVFHGDAVAGTPNSRPIRIEMTRTAPSRHGSPSDNYAQD